MKSLCFILIILSFLFTEYAYPQRKIDKMKDKSERETAPIRRREPDPVIKHRDSGSRNIKRKDDEKEKIIIPDKTNPDERPQHPGINPHPPKIIKVENVCNATIHLPVKIYTSQKEEGIIKLEEKNYFEAIELFTQALIKNKKDLELYFLRGTAELEYGIYDLAIEDFTYYLKFFDDDKEAFFSRGLSLLYIGEKEDAKKDFLLAQEYGHDKARGVLNKYF